MKKKTPWFPGDALPLHFGVYERQMVGNSRCFWYSYFGKNGWGWSEVLPRKAASRRGVRSCFQVLPWRGLAVQP